MDSTQAIAPRRKGYFRVLTFFKKRLITVVVVLPLVAALFFSTRSFFLALAGIVLFKESAFVNYNWESPSSALTGRRMVQMQFMNVGLHIPLENIIATGDDSSTTPRMVDLMTHACGRGDLIVWVPFRFKLPFIGDWVSERCWVPKIKKGKK